MKIAICITTRNRPEILAKTCKQISDYFPTGTNIHAKLFIVDDASDIPVANADYRFEHNAGIPQAKNKCLRLAYDWGADHIFLFDDDTFPISDGWWKPYIESKEPHLMYQFKLPGKPKRDMRVIYKSKNIVAYSHTRGAMIYVERRVLDVVGGMDLIYLNGGFEHPDWTNRIHNAGLTLFRAMDIPDSSKYFHCLDEGGKNKSILNARNSLLMRNQRFYNQSRFSKEYKEFN